MHPESPLPLAEILCAMLTIEEADGLFAAVSKGSGRDGGAPDEYGAGIAWEELRMPTRYWC